MTGNVVVLEPGDERAKKIAKAMASQTANDILTFLSAGPKSLTDITDHLKIPLTTAKYHAENLLDAGLIIVSETKYSIKGREVKMYSLADQLLIVAPKQTNIRALLLKYTSLFGIVVAGTLAIYALTPLFPAPVTMESASVMMTKQVGAGPEMYGARAVADTNILQEVSPDIALAFLCGGAFVIFVMLCYEAYIWKKRR